VPIAKQVSAPVTISEQDDAISKSLVGARLSATPLDGFPGELPATLKRAYAIQAASIKRWPEDVVGWKVAMMPVPDRPRFTAERLAGPVFSSKVRSVEVDTRIVMPVYEGGFAAVEAEFVLELGASVLPTGENYPDEELIDIVSAWHCGAEIASSPMAVVNERGATSIISDFGNNAGVLVGPQIPDWRTRPLSEMPAKVIVDNETVGETTAAAVPSEIQTSRPLPLVDAEKITLLPRVCMSAGLELECPGWMSLTSVTFGLGKAGVIFHSSAPVPDW